MANGGFNPGAILTNPWVQAGLSMVPQVGELLGTTQGIGLRRALTGQQMTEGLREVEPEYQAPTMTGSMFSFPTAGGPQDVSLPEIGSMMFGERTATFEALSELGQEQAAQSQATREAIQQGLARGEDVSGLLQQATAQGLHFINQGLAGVEQFRNQTRILLGGSLLSSRRLLEEVRAQGEQIRADFALDVASQIDVLHSGIQAASDANFNEHLRSIEGSSGPLTGEERAGLRAIYDRDSARQVALGAGQLHASAMELKANLDASLHSNFTQMSAYAGQQVAGAYLGAMEAFSNAESYSATLHKAKADYMGQMATARSELAVMMNQFSLDGEVALFDMITNTVHPVAIFSDAMQYLFDTGWDIMANYNDLQDRELRNEYVILNPENAAQMANYGLYDADRQADDARNAAGGGGQGTAIGGGFGVAAGTAIGAMVGGPPGALIGGAIGGGAGAATGTLVED